MKRLINLINSIIDNGKYRYIIIAFILTILLMNNSLFGEYHIKKTIPDFKMLDMNFYTSVSDMYIWLKDIGDFGRYYYSIMLYVDLLLAVTFFLLLSCSMIKLMKALSISPVWHWLILFPLIRSIMDIIETVSLIFCTAFFPKILTITAITASISTPVKWIVLYCTIAILIVLSFYLPGRILASSLRRRISKSK